jgi:hypothetical protein
VNRIKQTVDHYTPDEQEELKKTFRIAVSIYVQGNGPETEANTNRAMAYEIRIALRERFENINTMRLTELVAKFCEVVKVKGSEWFSNMLYLKEQIVKANGRRRSDAELIAHIINVAPRYYNITLSILSQSNFNASDALSRAQTELRNYWKRNLEGKKGKPGGKFQGRRYKNESAYAFSGGKQKGNQGRYNSIDQSQPHTYQVNVKSKKSAGNKYWEKFKGLCTYCGMQGHKAIDCGVKKQAMNASSGYDTKNQKNIKCYLCGKQGRYGRNFPEKENNNLPHQPGLFVG